MSSPIGLTWFSIFLYTVFFGGMVCRSDLKFEGVVWNCLLNVWCRKKHFSNFWAVARFGDPRVMIFRTLDVVKETFIEFANLVEKCKKPGRSTKQIAEIQLDKLW